MIDYTKFVMNILEKYENTVMTGKELKEILGDHSECLLKIMNDFYKYYETDINTNMEFFHIFNIFNFTHNYRHDSYARQVFLTDDMKIHIIDGKMKADKLSLGKKYEKKEFMTDMFKKALNLDPFKANETMIKMIKNTPNAIQYIDQNDRTLEMMMEAVKKMVI